MTAQTQLGHPVTKVGGVGDRRAEVLRGMGIETVEDLLLYFPFRYEDYEIKDLADVRHDEKVTVQGKVHSEPSLMFYSRKKSRLTVRVLVERYLITAVIFNRPYMKKQLNPGDTVTITGKWNQHRASIAVYEIKKGSREQSETIAPVYSVKGEVTVKALRKMIFSALQQYGKDIEETLPAPFLQKYKLPERKAAVKSLHFPDDYNRIKHARRRIVYEELLLFQLKLQVFKKVRRENSKGVLQQFPEKSVEQFIEQLPFPLTRAQNRVIDEILTDMRAAHRMNRLLQGDVGSGKTIVAAIALFASVEARFQGALMVPTEILAEQHFESLQSLFDEFNVRIRLLTSSIKGKARREILHDLEQGDIDIIVGTHALIQEEVSFRSPGLVITDEQHRFGVTQRRTLSNKGSEPDVLYMTATPIPRTLALSLFGDMDVSTIDEMPAGRKPIETYWAKTDSLPRVLDFVEKELRKGRQAYVICPLIEESEQLDVQNAIDVHAALQQHFRHSNVGLMHGRLSAEEKEKVMNDFSHNHNRILVSTTVVEVGVNVPNASIMVIYDAERFGLAQLHQLRGRVGRGEYQSYCILLADPKSENGKERMRIMTETNDGFILSEKDLKLRGAGDFFGRKQSGIPEFKLADPTHDYKALEVARRDAAALIQTEEFWNSDTYAPLREALQASGAMTVEKID